MGYTGLSSVVQSCIIVPTDIKETTCRSTNMRFPEEKTPWKSTGSTAETQRWTSPSCTWPSSWRMMTSLRKLSRLEFKNIKSIPYLLFYKNSFDYNSVTFNPHTHTHTRNWSFGKFLQSWRVSQCLPINKVNCSLCNLFPKQERLINTAYAASSPSS